MAIWLVMVPLGQKSPASIPNKAAQYSSNALTVGSSLNTSSPTLDELLLILNEKVKIPYSNIQCIESVKNDIYIYGNDATNEIHKIRYTLKDVKLLLPEYFKKVQTENPQTLQNPQRMKRFVEVCIGTGKPYSSFIGKRKFARNFTPIVIGLEADREILYNRINQRVDLMISEGLLEEVKTLYPNKHLNALQTVGYRELFDYFDKKTTLDFAIEQIKMNTRRFAKRQMTWFKRTENATWFDYAIDRTEIFMHIEKQLKK